MANSVHVLIIEDDATVAEFLRYLLERRREFEFHPAAVETLEAGLLALAAREWNVIVLDLSLPDSEGIATVQRIQETAPEVPIVVLTGTSTAAGEAILAGAQEYLDKTSLNGDVLVRAIYHSVLRHRVRQQYQPVNAMLDRIEACTEQLGQIGDRLLQSARK